MNRIYQRTGSIKPGRSVFNLSYEKKFTGDMGVLYPIMCDEVIPGDVFTLGYECVLRAMPLVAPIIHQIDIVVHYFFDPYRLLFDDWEIFITGDTDGLDATTLPTWDPSGAPQVGDGTLWDFLYGIHGTQPDADSNPLDFPRRAYFHIYNEYYRDQNLITEIDWTAAPGTDVKDESLMKIAWEKDYFTAAATDQQRGTAPALPISGTTNAVWPAAGGANQTTMSYDTTASPFPPFHANDKDALENNTVDFSGATTFDVADLRLAIQIQRWQERNMRAGVRYEEFIKAHYGVRPGDDRLDRPEYIGGAKQPVIVSEVLQTESSDATTPQGTLAGHGISTDRRKIGTYRANEFGLIMGFMSIRPKPAYDQGLNRQWLRNTRYDFYSPEFANLSEQGILQREIFIDAVKANNETLFGYAGHWDEMRTKPNMLHGLMHTGESFDHWHIARQFGAAPTLNETFVEMTPRDDAWAAPSEPQFICNYANIIKAARPMPEISEPGMMDH